MARPMKDATKPRVRTAVKAGLRSFPPPEPITVLRVVGRDQALHLPSVKMEFALGSAPAPTCSLTVTSGTVPDTISARHAMLYRDGRWLQVVDQGSTNGTYFEDHREQKFSIKAGDSFRIAEIELLALDEHLAMLRDDLQWSIGYRNHLAVDTALRSIAKGSHVVIVGPPGLDQHALAKRIHATSPRREHPWIEVTQDTLASPELPSILEGARHGTAYVELTPPPKGRTKGRTSSIASVRTLLSNTYRVHVIVSAPRADDAYARLPGLEVTQDAIVEVTPLARRREDIVELLDFLFAELPSSRRIRELKDEQVAGLIACEWPGNIDELREAVAKLHALVVNGGNQRATARALSLSPSTIVEFCKSHGLS